MKEFLKNRWKELTILALVFVCLTLIMSTTCSHQENDRYRNNIEALTDTIKQYQLKNGELLYEKQAYILEKAEMEKYLEMSKVEIRDIEKKLHSKIAYINKLEAEVRIDTLTMHDSVYIVDNHQLVDFEYKDKWLAVNGRTIIDSTHANTTLNHVQMSVPIKLGMTEDHQLFATSENPYVSISSLDGATIQSYKTKPKHFNVGLQLGFGAQYDVLHKSFGVGPYVGVGIAYGFSF